MINRSEILKMEKRSESPMPAGLLQGLSYEEILDLLAIMKANGDQNAKAFQ